MNARFLPSLIFILILISTATFAEEPPSKSVSPFQSIVPASIADSGGREVSAPEPIEASSSRTSASAPLNEPPPSDPEFPAWGETLVPTISPIIRPPVQYNLVGPSRGLSPKGDEQFYDAIISDPDVVTELNSQIGQPLDVFRPDGMGPIGLFGDHTLPAGSAFISYRYLQNSFDQNYNGSHRTGVPTNFPLAPTRMLQDSQIALVEYGVTQDLTMLAYLPFQHNEVNLQTATGSEKQAFTNPGDLRIQGLLKVTRGERSQSHLNLGLSLPVGFLEQTLVFGGTPSTFPYPLLTSSGTYDLLLGYTYRRQTDYWTWGGQANVVVPTGKNTLGYELGNQFQLTAWASRRWTDYLSTSARLDGHWQGDIRGSNTSLDPTLSPINQANTQGREYLNGLLGVNYLLSRPGHRIRDQRLFLESGIPLYQWVDGPQLGLTWTLNAGWGMSF